MKTFILVLVLTILLSACSKSDDEPSQAEQELDLNGLDLVGAQAVEMQHTETFKVYERDGYRIVDLKAPFVSWGGEAQGADQHARIVLVPKTIEPPPLKGDLSEALIVRTPVERIATNYGFLEAVVEVLEVEDRLVAVGGVKSYNDDIRERSRNGELAQVGYGWHSPPEIDPLLNSRPDVFLMVLGGLGHAEHYERIKKLGVPVVPIFFEAETSYMGPLDYVRLVGMMTGKEQRAKEFVAMVTDEVDQLKALVADQPKKEVLSSWYAGGGRWMVTIRNADNRFLIDAGGINPLAEPDDVRIDDFKRVGTEVLLEKARDIDCWIIRDPHSTPFDDVGTLEHFKAWREGCLFAFDGRIKAEADTFDIYQMGLLRPDWILGDMVRMLHPSLRSEDWVYLLPDSKTPRNENRE